MFDKIPSLKDFIIYFIPGLLISYFGLNVVNAYRYGDLTAEMIAKNTSLSFIGIVFSFLIGFLFSQGQIISFNLCLNKIYRKRRTISYTQKYNDEIKETLVSRIKDTFEIPGKDIEEDHLIVFICLNFVKAKANQESHLYVDRHNNLSNLALATPLPAVLAFWDILLNMNCSKDAALG